MDTGPGLDQMALKIREVLEDERVLAVRADHDHSGRLVGAWPPERELVATRDRRKGQDVLLSRRLHVDERRCVCLTEVDEAKDAPFGVRPRRQEGIEAVRERRAFGDTFAKCIDELFYGDRASGHSDSSFDRGRVIHQRGHVVSRVRLGLEASLGWLDQHLGAALAALPSPRDLSLFEVTLFCLITHLDFGPSVTLAGYPALLHFADAYGARPACQRTRYRTESRASSCYLVREGFRHWF